MTDISDYLEKQKTVEIWEGTIEKLEKMTSRPDWQTKKLEEMRTELARWKPEAEKMREALSPNRRAIVDAAMEAFRAESLQAEIDQQVKFGSITAEKYGYANVGESPANPPDCPRGNRDCSPGSDRDGKGSGGNGADTNSGGNKRRFGSRRR